jgi:cellulose synthase/poly-beta-1,6-N-acetylglucosamine synthase-like glycosyltransferase
MSAHTHSDEDVLVSVFIPVLNEAKYLPSTVPCMLAQECDGRIEFIFIDGGSEDQSAALLAGFARADDRIRILRNPARRTPHALNIALREARGEYVARMDAHAYYPSRYLQAGIERLASDNTGVKWVSGMQVPVGRSAISRLMVVALTGMLGRGDSEKWPSGPSVPEEFEVGTSVFTGLWRRETVDALGGWDERFPVGQDSEMAARIMRDGGRIICIPEMAAEYVPRDSIQGIARAYRRYGEARGKLLLRHPSALPPSRLLPPALVTSAVAAALPTPRWLVRPARTVMVAYGGALLVSAHRHARSRGPEAALLPLVYMTMHFSWGVGFFAAVTRYLPRRSYFRGDPHPLQRGPFSD